MYDLRIQSLAQAVIRAATTEKLTPIVQEDVETTFDVAVIVGDFATIVFVCCLPSGSFSFVSLLSVRFVDGREKKMNKWISSRSWKVSKTFSLLR